MNTAWKTLNSLTVLSASVQPPPVMTLVNELSVRHGTEPMPTSEPMPTGQRAMNAKLLSSFKDRHPSN